VNKILTRFGTDAHNALSPIVTKLELLSRLSPMLDTDRERAQALAILNEIMGDYVRALRQALDALVEEGDRR
jgi:hypothetical protein